VRLLVALAAALAIAAPAGALSASARVQLVSRDPAAVAGTGFRAGERVVVTATDGDVTLRKTVLASVAGRFTARWTRRLPVSPCEWTAVSAVGSKGSGATWKSVVRDCPPPQPRAG
jgi:hypothetical protein